jgi:hypothetical protein
VTVKRILSAVAAAALGLALLSACGDEDGGSASGDFCADLEAIQKELSSVSGGDASDLETLLDKVEELKDEAPEEVAEDWELLFEAFEKIVQAFQDAGLSPEDIQAIQNGQIPDGVDQQALTDAYAALQELASDSELTEAGENINKHAMEECGVDLE